MLPSSDHSDLPVGLPDHVYASWLSARKELRSSTDLHLGELRYQFCCGYVRALIDAGVIDDHYGSIVSSHLREIWLGLMNHLSQG
ncbi:MULTISPECIES: hypothetical protein [Pseudomonas]|uniref:Uncharacterized protein n=1 Tax=Pseudomonas quercus TaxID=2722792 RepID=A0ABX0YNT2_9PSED|nr:MULTISPECIES: hypothetical protein [Pseudomonas]MBF7144956.1 hypothetical protein [Pseudomonas sp. LY10J]NJP03548.1 hypothetical protein [Pseudomonas quercus]